MVEAPPQPFLCAVSNLSSLLPPQNIREIQDFQVINKNICFRMYDLSSP